MDLDTFRLAKNIAPGLIQKSSAPERFSLSKRGRESFWNSCRIFRRTFLDFKKKREKKKDAFKLLFVHCTRLKYNDSLFPSGKGKFHLRLFIPGDCVGVMKIRAVPRGLQRTKSLIKLIRVRKANKWMNRRKKGKSDILGKNFQFLKEGERKTEKEKKKREFLEVCNYLRKEMMFLSGAANGNGRTINSSENCRNRWTRRGCSPPMRKNPCRLFYVLQRYFYTASTCK